MTKVPKWMFDYAQKCREAFGIGWEGFNFYLVEADVVDDDPTVGGSTTTSVRYSRAEVTVRRGLKPTDANYTLITHEVLHAATGEMRQAINRILELVPVEHHAHAEELWADGNEAVVTRLSQALTPLLRAMDRKLADKDGNT